LFGVEGEFDCGSMALTALEFFLLNRNNFPRRLTITPSLCEDRRMTQALPQFDPEVICRH
jgi:hypothetical protein